MDWIGQHWLDWASLLVIAAGVWWLMPRAFARAKVVGVLLAVAGTVLLASHELELARRLATREVQIVGGQVQESQTRAANAREPEAQESTKARV